MITSSEHLNSLSFFVPELRHHPLNHPKSIMTSMYKAFDHFNFTPDFSQLSIQYLLLLPLRYFFVSIPPQHWLLKHICFPAAQFFVFDTNQQRLRPKVTGEYTIKPSLCKQLYKQILNLQSIHLQSYVWNYILNDISIE